MIGTIPFMTLRVYLQTKGITQSNKQKLEKKSIALSPLEKQSVLARDSSGLFGL